MHELVIQRSGVLRRPLLDLPQSFFDSVNDNKTSASNESKYHHCCDQIPVIAEYSRKAKGKDNLEDGLKAKNV